jgi:hypothetical protein
MHAWTVVNCWLIHTGVKRACGDLFFGVLPQKEAATANFLGGRYFFLISPRGGHGGEIRIVSNFAAVFGGKVA